MGSIFVDGVERPVTDDWHAENIAPYPELASWDHDKLELERSRLLRQSDLAAKWAPGVLYTRDDEKRLQAVTKVINAHRATRAFIDGLAPSENGVNDRRRTLDEFGFRGVDQIHGNASTHECGCRLHYVFDHHRRFEEVVEHHPHHPLKVCDGHAHFGEDFKAHFHAVRAKTQSEG